MFSRAIRFLLVMASAAVVALVVMSAGSFTTLLPHDLNILEKVTSIIGSKEAVEVVEEAKVDQIEEAVETIEAIEAELPEEEVVEEIDSLRNTTIESEE